MPVPPSKQTRATGENHAARFSHAPARLNRSSISKELEGVSAAGRQRLRTTLAVQNLRHGDSTFLNGIKKLVVPSCVSCVNPPERTIIFRTEYEVLSAARIEFLVNVSAQWSRAVFVPPMEDDEALPALKALLGKETFLGGLGHSHISKRRVFWIYEELEMQWPPE